MIYYDDVWDAINQYVRACGGNPDTKKASAKRLVSVIQQQVRITQREAFEDGVIAAFRKVPMDADCYEEVGRAIDRIDNPYERKKP